MNKFDNIINYGLIGLNVLLIFLLIFEKDLVVPLYLQPLGRMHPLLLHLPIGLFMGIALLMVFKKEFEANTFSKVYKLLTGSTALLAVSTALFGLFLSNESGYSMDQLFWHKWTGVAFSVIVYLLYLFPVFKKKSFQWSLIGGGLIAMLVAGHIGGEITHGEDFLFEAFHEEKTLIISDTSNLYTAKIYPIFEDKCVQCHNDQKTKGELNMSSIAKIMAGGKNGMIWEAGNALNSHLIKRALLPLEDKKHMPPRGKVQLTDYELQLLTQWINKGATTDKRIGDFKEEVKFYELVMAGEQKEAVKSYNFAAASQGEIESVNTPFCSVYPLAYNSPALEAKFFVRQRFDKSSLKNLLTVKEQIVSLNLSKMPITDEELTIIAEFKNLEYLSLNATDIEGKNLEALASLSNLKSLAISNTKVSKDNLSQLSNFTQLQELFVWETAIASETIEALSAKAPSIKIYEGFDPSKEAALQLNPPQLIDEVTVLKQDGEIELKHVLPNVEIRYTLDGSQPDSVSGQVYTKPIPIKGYTKLRALAVKEGWLASIPLEVDFYKATYTPEKSTLISPPNEQYSAELGKSLIDNLKGSLDNFKDNKWLGYKDKPMEALFEFKEARPVKSITLSYLIAVDGYIMPPTTVQFYAGNDRNNLKLIATKQPPKVKMPEARKSLGINAEVPSGQYKFFKIIAQPINPLPSWHQGAGQRGWFFVDEVFFN